MNQIIQWHSPEWFSAILIGVAINVISHVIISKFPFVKFSSRWWDYLIFSIALMHVFASISTFIVDEWGIFPGSDKYSVFFSIGFVLSVLLLVYIYLKPSMEPHYEDFARFGKKIFFVSMFIGSISILTYDGFLNRQAIVQLCIINFLATMLLSFVVLKFIQLMRKIIRYVRPT